VHVGEEDHAWPGWTTSTGGQDSPWKSQSEWYGVINVWNALPIPSTTNFASLNVFQE